MSVIVSAPESKLWEEICKEFALQRPPFDPDDDNESVTTEYDEFNPAKHNPVFYGKMYAKVDVDSDINADFDSSLSHPSCVGYSFINKPPKLDKTPAAMPPNRFTCPPAEYLNYYVFPYLLPALEEMMKQAKVEKCFERRKTKFNACDFITEYLYKNNPNAGVEDRHDVDLWEIPFIKEWLKNHSRPPLPLSLVLTDEEAATLIQSYWRGYLVRRDTEVQDLRAWQREWREDNRGIQNRISEFWNKQMPSVIRLSIESSEMMPADTESVGDRTEVSFEEMK
uniref:IQ domain-containing protein K n=1 Tax=Arion vulgaris TaxID=1028688 RepID=A0A0B6ZA78_9EUPU